MHHSLILMLRSSERNVLINHTYDSHLDSTDCHPDSEIPEVEIPVPAVAANFWAMLRYNLLADRDLWSWSVITVQLTAGGKLGGRNR